MKHILLLCIALLSLLGCNKSLSDKNAISSHEENSQEPAASGLPISDVEVISVSLADYTIPGGNSFQQVKTILQNKGKHPIRTVDAKISWFDADGKLIKSADYTIFAKFNDEAGLLPGEIYTPAPTEGFLLPLDSNAASAKVQITEVQERFPE